MIFLHCCGNSWKKGKGGHNRLLCFFQRKESGQNKWPLWIFGYAENKDLRVANRENFLLVSFQRKGFCGTKGLFGFLNVQRIKVLK